MRSGGGGGSGSTVIAWSQCRAAATPHHTTRHSYSFSVQVHALSSGHEPLSDAAGGRLSTATGRHAHVGLASGKLDVGPAQEVVDKRGSGARGSGGGRALLGH